MVGTVFCRQPCGLLPSLRCRPGVVVANLLRNLLGTDSGVGLGGTQIRLAAWLLEEPRPQCGLWAPPNPRRLNVGIWAVGA